MTHLADADGPATDTTEEQLTRFRKAIEIVRASGFRVPLIHAANSAGAVRFPDAQFSLCAPASCSTATTPCPHPSPRRT